jgi:hypothetical protein
MIIKEIVRRKKKRGQEELKVGGKRREWREVGKKSRGRKSREQRVETMRKGN